MCDEKPLKFQSLFWWNMPSNLRHKRKTKFWCEFQSLFWWNMPSNMSDHLVLDHQRRCFNPCFDGTCLQTRYKAYESGFPRLVSILVLMEHAFKQNGGGGMKVKVNGFNPCFDGTCLQTRKFGPMMASVTGVSILVLMEHAFKLGDKTLFLPHFSRCFNPCFDGTCLQTWKWKLMQERCLRVSILVLMEHAFKPFHS